MSQVKGKGKYGIGASDNTPDPEETFVVTGRNFRDPDMPGVDVAVAFGLGHGWRNFVGTPTHSGKIAIECSLPARDPINNRDLSAGAEGVVYEYINNPDGTVADVKERGRILIYPGADEDSE
jgi:hypothetical protein